MATASSGIQKLLQVGTKIVAVGRNYAAHAKELGNAVPKVIIFDFNLLFQNSMLMNGKLNCKQ